MIKVIAFDLVGVLVRENDTPLTFEEEKLERMFGQNISDEDFFKAAREFITNDTKLVNTINTMINKIYDIKNPNLFEEIKNKYQDIKIVIATNHVSYIRNYINKKMKTNYLDNIFISAEIHKVKPNYDFYNYLLNELNIKNNELLFLDDSEVNIKGAKELGINTIKVNSNTNLFDEIMKFLDK